MQAAVNSAAGQWLSRKPGQPAVRRSTVIAILASTAGVCLLLLGGLLWKRLDTPPPGGQGRPVTIASEPVDARMLVDRTDNPAPQTIAPAPQTTAVRGRGAVTAVPQKSARRAGSRAVSAGRRQTRRPDAVAPSPRPLSPGEFGRTPSR
jgi:hypothetical protein